MAEFPFLGGSFNGRSPSFDGQRSINCYLEPSESGTSRSAAVLYGTPGLAPWLSLDGGRVRGCLRFSENVAIVVAGTKVWKVERSKVATEIGTVADVGPVVSMASNGTTVMMVDGPGGYFIDPAEGTIAAVASENFFGADRVDFIDGYFIFNRPDTGQFQITGLYSTDIEGLDFATAEGGPDNIVSLIADHRELWLFGEDTTEVWYNVGDVDFPFQRIQGAFLEVGCIATASVAKADNSIFWLASDDRGFGTVQRAAGYSPQRVSNHAFEFAVAQYMKAGTVADAVAYTYSQEGHTFYVISFPTANATWCLDVSTGLWHERLYRDPVTAQLERHRSNCQMNFAGLTIVGDYETGNLYALDLDTFTDNGVPLPLIRIAPHITNDTKRVLFHALELTMQTGVGLTEGQGADPQAMLQFSDDGGYAWSNELWTTIGRIGERNSRVRWLRLGQSRDRVFKVTITDPIRRVITSASLDTTACAS